MMKYFFTPFFCLLVFIVNQSAAQRSCGTSEYIQYLKEKNPRYEEQLKEAEFLIQKYIAENALNPKPRTVITIPVVVHVVYKTSLQNISDAQIQSQIDVLNEDFRRLNADTSETPGAFKSLAADCEIEFCLAQRDPEGNPTNGIERVSTTGSNWTYDDKVKHSDEGGCDAWDVERYFNIWSCDLTSGLLGYGAFPTSNLDNNYGVVIHYEAFGRTGILLPGYDKGRSGTHEVGHCFNLFHIWGDDGNGCTGNDFVDDTPNQADENYFCPNFPHISCSNGPDGDMFMNYMDYADDDCKNIFTQGQKERMLGAIENFLDFLLVSDACLPVPDLDAGLVSATQIDLCVNDYTPVISVKNFGLDTLVSLNINYSVDGGSQSTFAWSGILYPGSSTDVQLPVINLSAGSHEFLVTVTDPNGGTDGYSPNDSHTIFLNVSTEGVLLPLEEDFSSSVVPPPGFQLVNPDGDLTWQFKPTGHLSPNAAYVNNFDYNVRGEIDELILPHVDLTSIPSPKLTFYVAYQLYTNPTLSTNHSDTLEVFLSTDCGITWNTIYKKWSTDLVTVSPTWSHNEFTPNSPDDWRLEIIELDDYASNANAIIKFRGTTDFENNLYIDKINLTETVGLDEKSITSFGLYPNPASQSVMISLPSLSRAWLRVSDALGRVIELLPVSGGDVTLDVSAWPEGIYSVAVITGEGTALKKLDVVK